MNMTYDDQVDAMYLQIKDAEIARSEAIETDIVCDYDAANNVLGIELLWVSCNFNNAFSTIQRIEFADSNQKKACLYYLLEHVDVSRSDDPTLSTRIDAAKKLFRNNNLVIEDTKDRLEGIFKKS
ncbi:Protein of unknown function DUF2283 [Thalassoporum mexicanum PCC 7367]|uniref:DUF2283 domain-containing protein n=1 Tax=Thalassoporum mexicanum TaxID=3457544 RepID=UPI00029FF736|nr:DUF2283 domain-containing protein [Pseudanabaena sp. PCC 7367]AFY68850.1 Protein of unknown function DUF2283 [Pseudanabaena sp. PCC 7367]